MKLAGRFLTAALLLALAAPVSAQDIGLQQIDVTASPIAQFKIGSQEKLFGRLEFIGGLEMNASARNFGALSAFHFLDAGGKFIGVADTGFWFAGTVTRDGEGRPSGMSDFRMNPMLDENGGAFRKKWESDAEGMFAEGKNILVSFEREHRISRGTIDPDLLTVTLSDLELPIPAYELRNNKGFETLAQSPKDGPLAGAAVAVTEKSLNKSGNVFAAVMSGPQKGVFFVRRNGEFDITDGDFLPDGDLLLLERRFNMAEGIAMRLTLFKGGDIKPGATISGETLLETDLAYQIDNMEALDVWKDADGATRVTLLSDDNHSILQRNLLLEFKLAE